MEISKLVPPCKNYIWGGNKLRERYNKVSCDDIIAESWELSLHADGKTKLTDGTLLEKHFTAEILGENCQKFSQFPLLIKLIDASNWLSVQVHPNDSYAKKHCNSYGKSEMWFIVDADEGAGIYLGFNRNMSAEMVQKAIEKGNLTDYLQFHPVKKGEHYFIESGTIHAIGSGCVICEVQQNSNLTYRVYDYNRVDANGNARQLHIDDALAVLNYEQYDSSLQRQFDGNTIAQCNYFTVKHIDVKGEIVLATDSKSFACVVCVEGSGLIGGNEMQQGDSFFVPANYGKYIVSGNAKLIVATV